MYGRLGTPNMTKIEAFLRDRRNMVFIKKNDERYKESAHTVTHIDDCIEIVHGIVYFGFIYIKTNFALPSHQCKCDASNEH